jgi:hypothetical protein
MVSANGEVDGSQSWSGRCVPAGNPSPSFETAVRRCTVRAKVTVERQTRQLPPALPEMEVHLNFTPQLVRRLYYSAVSGFKSEVICSVTVSTLQSPDAVSQNPLYSSVADSHLCNIADGFSQFSRSYCTAIAF